MKREFFAATEEEALQRASAKLNIPKENLRFQIINGTFGGLLVKKKVGIVVQFDEKSIGKKENRLQGEIEKRRGDPNDLCQFVLKTILEKLSLDSSVELQDNNDQVILVVNFQGESLDTRRGDIRELRSALQYLLNRIMNNGSDVSKGYIIDFGGELKKRTETMQNIADFLGTKVAGLKKTMRIQLMDAQDRRLLHLALLENQKVSSFSQGEGRFRVLCLRKKEEE